MGGVHSAEAGESKKSVWESNSDLNLTQEELAFISQTSLDALDEKHSEPTQPALSSLLKEHFNLLSTKNEEYTASYVRDFLTNEPYIFHRETILKALQILKEDDGVLSQQNQAAVIVALENAKWVAEALCLQNSIPLTDELRLAYVAAGPHAIIMAKVLQELYEAEILAFKKSSTSASQVSIEENAFTSLLYSLTVPTLLKFSNLLISKAQLLKDNALFNLYKKELINTIVFMQNKGMDLSPELVEILAQDEAPQIIIDALLDLKKSGLLDHKMIGILSRLKLFLAKFVELISHLSQNDAKRLLIDDMLTILLSKNDEDLFEAVETLINIHRENLISLDKDILITLTQSGTISKKTILTLRWMKDHPDILLPLEFVSSVAKENVAVECILEAIEFLHNHNIPLHQEVIALLIQANINAIMVSEIFPQLKNPANASLSFEVIASVIRQATANTVKDHPYDHAVDIAHALIFLQNNNVPLNNDILNAFIQYDYESATEIAAAILLFHKQKVPLNADTLQIAKAGKSAHLAAPVLLSLERTGVPLASITIDAVCLATRSGISPEVIINAFIEGYNRQALQYILTIHSAFSVNNLPSVIILLISSYFSTENDRQALPDINPPISTSNQSPFLIAAALGCLGETSLKNALNQCWNNTQAEIKSAGDNAATIIAAFTLLKIEGTFTEDTHKFVYNAGVNAFNVAIAINILNRHHLLTDTNERINLLKRITNPGQNAIKTANQLVQSRVNDKERQEHIGAATFTGLLTFDGRLNTQSLFSHGSASEAKITCENNLVLRLRGG